MNQIRTTGTILDQIIARKVERIAQSKERVSSNELIKLAAGIESSANNFAESLQVKGSLAIIGEIKKASPSKGIIQADFNPVEQAKAYENANIQAISVLTEEDYFLGSDNYLREVAKNTSLPILRKDFIIDPYQILEAKVLGASAILLICAVLSSKELKQLMQTANELGMAVLVEVHNLEELMTALDLEAKIIGINNRDLNTFHVDLATTDKLAGIIPAGRIIVSESGIKTAKDMAKVYRAGAHAVLIGETLMRSAGSADSVGKQIDLLYGEIPR